MHFSRCERRRMASHDATSKTGGGVCDACCHTTRHPTPVRLVHCSLLRSQHFVRLRLITVRLLEVADERSNVGQATQLVASHGRVPVRIMLSGGLACFYGLDPTIWPASEQGIRGRSSVNLSTVGLESAFEDRHFCLGGSCLDWFRFG